jgi:hypothetical protein
LDIPGFITKWSPYIPDTLQNFFRDDLNAAFATEAKGIASVKTPGTTAGRTGTPVPATPTTPKPTPVDG